MKTSTQQKIFSTIPDHYFWDIKTPLEKPTERIFNSYNPFRRSPYESFFDMREQEEFFERREHKQNLRDNISTHRKY